MIPPKSRYQNYNFVISEFIFNDLQSPKLEISKLKFPGVQNSINRFRVFWVWVHPGWVWTHFHPYLALNSFLKSYYTFILNYNTNGWEKPVLELHAMLKTAKKNIPIKTTHKPKLRTPRLSLLRVREKKFSQTPKSNKKKEKVTKEDTCFECGVIDHWKRNCPTYLVELKNKKAEVGTSGIYVIYLEPRF
uniref:CCHC-type domain-containing protein n=1 Tax=Lactuca sativa TaxID=4236 RepID=A0A9R1VLX9_LACSA|nr:hypothetical protein LSAT_V11C500280080 [Lactuca sativa]